MIEINLVPDVKQELIKAQRVRSFVIFIAGVAGLGAVGVTVLLATYVFGAQFVRNNFADAAIASESKKLSQVEGLDNALTIQNQMTKISELHKNKKIDSRLFNVLTAIIPPAPNSVNISRTVVNSKDNRITIEAQADNGFPALEVFLKTIAATQFEYAVAGGKSKTVPLASKILDSNRSYGQDAAGRRVLRFTVNFTYPKQLFARDSSTDKFEAKIIGPTSKTNVTDSYVGVPDSLFTIKAADAPQQGDQ